jgi:mannose-1-phosphate guanylyltransferase
LKALLLVGGFATRLRPLSLSRPKCLFPLDNKPIIDYLLENLGKAGCSEAVLAVNNHAEMIMKHLGHEKYGIKLRYSLEETPLGTGGPIKYAEDILRGEDFLVLNGDILSFIDYRVLFDTHTRLQPIATVTLTQVDDPSRYGVVRLSQDDRILEFVEKPPIQKAPSNWINAGCYALSPKVLDIIPESKVSIERDVFPKLAEQSQLMGYKYYGKWIDIGVPEDYLEANRMLQTDALEKVAWINPKSVVGRGSKILDSIIWENSSIGRNTTIIHSIIGANVTVGENVLIERAILADNVRIDKNLIIAPGTKIGPNIHIETSIKRPGIEIN